MNYFLFNLVIWSPRVLQSTYHQIDVPMQEENVYLKILAVEEQIVISGGKMVRIPQKLYVLESRCRGYLVLESRCRGTSSFYGILTLMPPDITISSRFSTTVAYFSFCIY